MENNGVKRNNKGQFVKGYKGGLELLNKGRKASNGEIEGGANQIIKIISTNLTQI